MEHHAQVSGLMMKTEQTNCVLSMMLALPTPGGCNDLTAKAADYHKRWLVDDKSDTTSVVYTIKGDEMFASVVQVHLITISQIAAEVSKSLTLELALKETYANNAGHISSQTMIAMAFLQILGELNAMACLTGR